MVTLSQTLSNRECHSQSPVRVKVTQTENPFQYVKRITTVNILPHKFPVVLQLAREGRQLLFRGYDLRLTVTKKRNGGYLSDAVTYEQSVILRVSVLDDCSCHASRQIVSWQKDKAVWANSALCFHLDRLHH
ncbi:hypothetical protein NQZ68_000589 [Dissostichus eleginoides]|nr:hypothetical protein NQZ68_000589 [Dissostichus eleginoides]